MHKTKKISLFLILCLISISILTGCQNNQPTSETKEEIVLEKSQAKQELTLNRHGCIGCGICTQVAPDNFTMNGRKAEVISQKNITSTQVNNAIENCPTSVIEIIEA